MSAIFNAGKKENRKKEQDTVGNKIIKIENKILVTSMKNAHKIRDAHVWESRSQSY